MGIVILDIFKPSTWLSDVSDGLMGSITAALRTFLFWLDTVIYKLIIDLYSLFDRLCNARLLDNEVLKLFSERVGLILGILMFFIVVFSFIKMLIDPDKISDKENGAIAIVKKVLLVIVMLAFSNFAFQSLYGIQKIVIGENIISKLILPFDVSEEDKRNFGNIISMQLMGAFYQVNSIDSESVKEIGDETKKTACTNMTNFFLNQVLEEGNFDFGYSCLNESIQVEATTESDYGINEEDKDNQVYVINFNGIVSVVAGIIVVYVLFMYCFGVGIRMVQLAFLEIISPMAIVSYLAPKKDNMFSKWCKIYFGTYIDVFIRIAIINFVIFLIMTLFAVDKSGQFIFWDTVNPTNTAEKSFFMVVIIVALLTFAKKAPDLLKELFPAGASKLGLGLSPKDFVGLGKGFKIGGSVLGGAAAGLVAGTAGFASGRPLGFLTGALRGGLSGLKGQGISKTASGAWKTQTKANKTIADVKANGGSPAGYYMSQLRQNFGMRTAYDDIEGQYSEAKSYVDTYSSVKKKADSEVDKFASNYYFKDASGKSYSLLELDKMRVDDVHYTASERAVFDDVYNKIHGFARDQAMNKDGAVKAGRMVWTDNGTGDWKDIEKSMDDTAVTDIATNSEIASGMKFVVESAEGSKATGTRFERAKAANDTYEDKYNNKVNDEEYNKAKANAGK